MRIPKSSLPSGARLGDVSKQRRHRLSTVTTDWCGGVETTGHCGPIAFGNGSWTKHSAGQSQSNPTQASGRAPEQSRPTKSHPNHRQRCAHDAMQTLHVARRVASARRAAPRWQWLSVATRRRGWRRGRVVTSESACREATRPRFQQC